MNKYRLFENGNITVSGTHKRVTPDKSNGFKEKTYTIDWKVYRELVSATVNLFDKKKNEVIFLTLTFPIDIDEKQANVCFSTYLDNLKKTYKLNAYVAVKEFTKNGRPHYHLLADLPFQPIKRLNNSWCSSMFTTTSDVRCYSNNCVRLPEKKNRSVVKEMGAIVRYLAKYIGKSRGELYRGRCFFVSRNVRSRPRELTTECFYELCDTFETRTVANKYTAIVMTKKTVFPNREQQKIDVCNNVMERLIDVEKRLALAESIAKKLRLDAFELRGEYERALDGVGQIDILQPEQRIEQRRTEKQQKSNRN